MCVDLDGTLIRGNLVWECILALLKSKPGSLLLLPFWLVRGPAFVKHQLARRVVLGSLPSSLSAGRARPCPAADGWLAAKSRL